MENDSPNLFDSEPLSAKLTTQADDVLSELIEEINADAPSAVNVEQNVDVDDVQMDIDDEQNAVVEYHTDESEDESEENGEADEQTRADDPVDRSTERPDADSTKTKEKDGHKGLPTNRVKCIMKMDPDVSIVAGEAVFLVTKATEAFVGLLAQHCHKAMVSSNKKTLQKKHIDAAIEENVPLEFLEGALDW